jgi:hypothetical protein
MNRKKLTVDPPMFIASIMKLIGHPWSLNLGNVTEVHKSSSFSVRNSFLSSSNSQQQTKANVPHNQTKNIEIPQYKEVYYQHLNIQKKHIITKLYMCDQVELESSEFLLINDQRVLYSYATKRFLFDGQFALILSDISGQLHARICIEDSGLFKAPFRNVGVIFKSFCNYLVVPTVLLKFLYQLIY